MEDLSCSCRKAGNGLNATVEAGKEYEVTVVVDEKGLDDAIGIESVIMKMSWLISRRTCSC